MSQKEQRAVFVIQKCIVFVKKKYVAKNFILKRTQGSVNSC